MCGWQRVSSILSKQQAQVQRDKPDPALELQAAWAFVGSLCTYCITHDIACCPKSQNYCQWIGLSDSPASCVLLWVLTVQLYKGGHCFNTMTRLLVLRSHLPPLSATVKEVSQESPSLLFPINPRAQALHLGHVALPGC